MAIAEPDPDTVSPNRLWMGDLEPFMDENYLRNTFAQCGYHMIGVKWVHNRPAGMMARYCFVEFSDSIVTKEVLYKLSNQFIPGTNNTKKFKLNWATTKKFDNTMQQEYNIFVANITPEVSSHILLEFFRSYYKSVDYAKVIEDEFGVSKGYGFVRFKDEAERNQSYARLDGAIGLGTKAIMIKPALAPKPSRVPMMPMQQQPQTLPVFPQTQVYSNPMQQLYGGYTTPGAQVSGYYAGWPQAAQAARYAAQYQQQVAQMQYGQGYAEQQQQYSQQYNYPTQTMAGQASVAPEGFMQAAMGVADADELLDPNIPLDVDKLNSELFQREKELFVQLDEARWKTYENGDNLSLTKALL